jgi:SOS-response transcriptional repressor LexA
MAASQEEAVAKGRIKRQKARQARLDATCAKIVALTKKGKGSPPSVRELSEALGRNISNVHKDLYELRVLGRVDWKVGKARTLRVIEK